MSSSDSPISSATLAVTALYASPSSSESCNQIRLIASWNPPEECEMIQKYLVEDHWGRSWSRFGGRAAKNVIKRGSGPAMSPLRSVKTLDLHAVVSKQGMLAGQVLNPQKKFHLTNEHWGSCSSSESERFTT